MLPSFVNLTVSPGVVATGAGMSLERVWLAGQSHNLPTTPGPRLLQTTMRLHNRFVNEITVVISLRHARWALRLHSEPPLTSKSEQPHASGTSLLPPAAAPQRLRQ
jgi:hypothetical protein